MGKSTCERRLGGQESKGFEGDLEPEPDLDGENQLPRAMKSSGMRGLERLWKFPHLKKSQKKEKEK